MTQEELDAVRAILLGQSIQVDSGTLTETWTCDNVNWTGFRCAVALNDGAGGYKDLTLDDWPSGAAVRAWARDVVTPMLQKGIDARAEEDASVFDDLIGAEI